MRAALLFLTGVTLGAAGAMGLGMCRRRGRSSSPSMEELAEKEQYLRLILANTPDHILIQDSNLKYVLVVNPQLGLTEADMLGKTDSDFLAPQDAEKLTRIKREVLNTGKKFSVEVPLVSKDGGLEYFEGAYIPKFNSNGQVEGLIGYFRNVTERKRAEEDRLAREKAESANHAKDRFLATLSHELRTPLTVILAWAQILKTRRTDTEKTKQGLDAIEKSALAQNRIIGDLLDVSRIAAGKTSLEIKCVDLTELIKQAVETLQLDAEKKSIRISEELGSEAVIVSGDPDRLKQVFWNLLSNAIKFTANSGSVTVTLTSSEKERKARVSVRDTGKGIPPEFLPHLFEPFSQADSSFTRAHGGLGLGLSLVKNLVGLHGGTVEAMSAGVETGATFTVSLPLAKGGSWVEERSAANETTLKRRDWGGLRVLFVDDEEDTREAMRTLLESRSMVVRLASSVAEALQMLDAELPDLIVSDIGMPNEDGFSLIRKVRARPAERGGMLPAIALTAFAEARHRDRALVEGYQAHLAKPIRAEELLGAIEDLPQLKKNRDRRP